MTTLDRATPSHSLPQVTQDYTLVLQTPSLSPFFPASYFRCRWAESGVLRRILCLDFLGQGCLQPFPLPHDAKQVTPSIGPGIALRIRCKGSVTYFRLLAALLSAEEPETYLNNEIFLIRLKGNFWSSFNATRSGRSRE